MADERFEAKRAKDDEFYTQFHDIEKEMNAYLDFNPDAFKGKTVLLPCDDPEWSNFTKFFAQKFEALGIKKLISTSYAPNSKPKDIPYQPTLFELESPEFDEDKTQSSGKIFTLTQDKTGDGVINVEDLQWSYLEGDGDFRSAEIRALRDEADIIITNPPFSLFREFLAWLVEADKHFAIIGNMNAINYKEVFPLIQENRLWLGASIHSGDREFQVPHSYTRNPAAARVDEEGNRFIRVPGIRWFANIDHGLRHQELSLMSESDNIKFSKHKEVKGHGYKKYDNYDAIEVPFTDAIPSDFAGVMGVPISFLSKYNPDQFEILGSTQRGCHDQVPDTKKYDNYREMKPDGTPTGSTGGKTNENPNLAGNDGKKNYFIDESGHTVQSAYSRIFIRHRKPSK
ncbi:hypothetical protein M2113_000612 [Aurantimicrobium minutum]|uniref:adenine-specific methyltransferase EcoRI family protein n=1 Tax=Aurantimicrobium minutum TaxID=708131 RepID=UPI00247678D4|nr:adenine-specific methyltransferase EcoRI family protein [Aurantimicrobium minutum]MDH6409651.1 hypothetical protein [Aurantimicrobium minutum]